MVEVVALCPIDKIHFSLINTHVQPLQSSDCILMQRYKK